MTEIETRKPIWYYCPESDIWCPFENINYIIPLTYPKLSIDEKQAEIDNLKSLFYQSQQKLEFSKGTKVYSKKYGYGIIQDIGKKAKIFTIKYGANIYEESLYNLMIDFPLIIRIINLQTVQDDVIRVSPFATSIEILEKISLLFQSSETQSVQEISIFNRAYFNGKALEKTHQSLEELKIQPFSKILVVASEGVVHTLQRFNYVYDCWSYSQNQLEAITFSVSKKIWLVGFGIYGPDKGTETSDSRPSPLNMVAQVHQGQEIVGMDPLQEKQVTIETELEEKLYQMKFSKPVQIMPDTKYSISLQMCLSICEGYSYYGRNGKEAYTTEDDIQFKFYQNDQSQGSDQEYGQFPEIYYFTN